MPFISIDGTPLFYRLEGADDLPTLVLAHSIGSDHSLWQPQLADLLRFFRVLRFDVRGHGASGVTEGDYSLDLLAADVLALVEALGIERFAYCGLSLGGMIGQRLALKAPERLAHLVLANTSSFTGDPSLWETRRRAVLEKGMGAIVEGALERSFSAGLRGAGDSRVATVRRLLLGTDPVGYAGCCAVIRDLDLRDALGSIAVPTLVIAGDRDIPMPWAGHSDLLAERIPGARVVRLDAAHLSNLERPRDFLAALLGFLLPAADGDPLETGFRTRRAVLGDAHVDRAIAGTTQLNAAFQEMITRYAWGTVWARPALDPRTRRLLVLASTVALGRWEEFRLHVRAGLAHELEIADLQEVLLQSAIYAGAPAANTAFLIAAEEIAARAAGALGEEEGSPSEPEPPSP
jgi:3-oxoadipate enol-lactonase / 4-carboxymuconolactone decarboxylase